MAITHILKDGTILNDISGHVVKMIDVPSAYMVMDRINESAQRKSNKRKENEQ